MTQELKRSGERVSEKTIAQIMRENELVARKKRRFKTTTHSKHTQRIADNLLQRNFSACAPNKVWVTDVTAVWTLAGWAYLAAIVDLFSRRVVGWAMSESNDTTLALAALDRALRQRKPPPGLVHHSDRGSPYGSEEYVGRLDQAGIVRSMSRKGDCWDNAPSESWFSTVEFECRAVHEFCCLEHAEQIIGEYIEGFYNPRRLHSALGFSSPVEFEISFNLSNSAA